MKKLVRRVLLNDAVAVVVNAGLLALLCGALGVMAALADAFGL